MDSNTTPLGPQLAEYLRLRQEQRDRVNALLVDLATRLLCGAADKPTAPATAP